MVAKEEIEQIKNLKGEARGQTVINAFKAVEIMEGKEGLKKLFEKLKEVSGWVKEYEDFQKKIKAFHWYPLWYNILPIVVAADIFNWDKEKIRQFGIYNQKVSFFEKVLLKYLVSVNTAAKTAGEHWGKHYSIGKLELKELAEEKKRVVLTLNDFSVHPVLCRLLEGYFQSVLSFVVPTKGKCEEIRCTFRGDHYHEFLFTWE